MAMSVTKSQYVPKDGNCSRTASVGKSLNEPFIWIREFLREEIPHDRVEIFSDFAKFGDSNGVGMRLYVADFFAALVALVVLGIVALVGGHEVIVERHCVEDPFNDAGI